MHTTTSADGTTIGYTQSGSGPALLLVHGTTADHRRWDPLLPYFEPHFTVYAMDRRGRGGSGDAPDYHILREAEDVAAVVDAIGGPVSVLGHSYGAVCSLEAALLTPNIHRLVLYEPPIPTGIPLTSPEVLSRMDGLMASGENEAALELFLRETVGMPEDELKAYRQLAAWPIRVKLAPTIPREERIDGTYTFEPARFAALQVPTLLLQGGDSPAYMRQATATVDAALPNSTIVILPDQRHVAMDTAPELFTSEVLSFLKA
jgi:pimeloyl-ACP methyl ester carboxylesterase